MATLTSNLAEASCTMPAATPSARPRIDAVGILSRIRRALRLARHRSREREIAEFVARSGGRLTDSVERELMDRHLRHATSGWL